MARSRKTARKGTSLNTYHSVAQLRSEGWSRLKKDTALLAEAAQEHREERRLLNRVIEEMALLEPIDSYWAFPSRQDYDYLHSLFDHREYDKLSRVVNKVNRALASLSYRHKPINLRADEDGISTDETDDFSDAHEERQRLAYHNRPYFEVLVVDNISTREEELLKASLRKMRRPDDPFVYEVLVVPTFEDALIAVLFNFNIQAVVIRYGFPFRSVHELDVLRQLLEDYEGDKLEGLSETDYGPALGAKIAEMRPELDLYLVTDRAVE
ncbi:MAG: hypothetical protein R3202_10585, partial [Candidatus Competibacterales bacterium]|nr:hypothetical protein [Candidatus Competibacterales bacterium]